MGKRKRRIFDVGPFHAIHVILVEVLVLVSLSLTLFKILTSEWPGS